MQMTPTISDAAYQQALSEMTELAKFEPDRGTAEAARMYALAMVIKAYHPDRRARELEDAESR